MPICPRCNKRPAKRQCPALRTKICAVCCASERMFELACPDSCDYLRSARAESRDREVELRLKEAKAGGSLDVGMNHRSMAAAYIADRSIVEAFRGTGESPIRDLQDSEALSALDNAIRNLETEESGLIYEHKEAALRVTELSRRIRQALEQAFEKEIAEERPRRSELIRALKYVRDAVNAHSHRPGAGPQSYLRYISLFCPWPEEQSQSLIV